MSPNDRFIYFADPQSGDAVVRVGPSGGGLRLTLSLKDDGEVDVRLDESSTNALVDAIDEVRAEATAGRLHTRAEERHSETFVITLACRHPSVAFLLDDHLTANEVVLPHLVMEDYRRWVEWAISTGYDEEVVRFLATVAEGWESGDNGIQNVISVSFLESIAYGDHAARICELLPAPLLAEINHYRRS